MQSLPIEVKEQLYCPYYCEENVWHLVKSLVASHPPEQGYAVYAVFISNPSRACLLLNQRAGNADEGQNYVIWDYHVVAVVTQDKAVAGGNTGPTGGPKYLEDPRLASRTLQASVWDLDSTLGLETPFDDWVHSTINPDLQRGVVRTVFSLNEPLFRTVPAASFLAHFASDRSHMLKEQTTIDTAASTDLNGRYTYPPPPWPVIGPSQLNGNGGETSIQRHNLWARYLDMTDPHSKSSEQALTRIPWEKWEHEGTIYGQLLQMGKFADLEAWATHGGLGHTSLKALAER